jgi:hypothetical protein
MYHPFREIVFSPESPRSGETADDGFTGRTIALRMGQRVSVLAGLSKANFNIALFLIPA